MKTTLDQQISDAKNLLDVLLVLKRITMLDTHVSTLAYVDAIRSPIGENGKYGICSCKPFPLGEGQKEYSIQAYYFSQGSEELLSEGKIVLVLFTDLNFISGLETPGPTPMQTQDTILHSLKYGVLVPLM